MTKKQLREQHKKQRAALTTEIIRHHSKKLTTLVITHPLFQQANNIALYWPCNNEINPLAIMQTALQQDKNCYLPVVDNTQLVFKQYTLQENLITSKFGIPEPIHGKAINPQQLDLTFVPLLAFDRSGSRVGTGAGFYDRSATNSTLVGLAYAMQETTLAPQDSWDLTLAHIVTEKEWITVKNDPANNC